MTAWWIALAGIAGTIIGAVAGAYIAHLLTRQQNKREKLWQIMVETYCEKMLDPLAYAGYQTYYPVSYTHLTLPTTPYV